MGRLHLKMTVPEGQGCSIYREYFKANVYTIEVNGPSGTVDFPEELTDMELSDVLKLLEERLQLPTKKT